MPTEETRDTLLCVGSDHESRLTLQGALPGHELVFARSAFDAIRCMNDNVFDGYILDFWLPDWTGSALCRHVRKGDPHAPVLFYTAASRPQDKARALRAGADAFLVKPVDPVTLRSKLHTLLSTSELDNVRACVEEERAIAEELARRREDLQSKVDHARALTESSLERTARLKAYKAFMEARGTHAHFERKWQQTFQTVRLEQENA
jgi:DNA-binding response OmpR family regulator